MSRKHDMIELKEELDDAYYGEGKSLVSDAEYDAICEYANLEGTGGSAPSSHQKRNVELPCWMGSITKIKTARKLEAWCQRFPGPYLIEDKLDGVGCLVCVEGENLRFLTRGTGSKGSDITSLGKGLGLKIRNPGVPVYARGELVIPEKVFREKFSSEFANARSAVAGCVNSTQPMGSVLEEIRFVAFEAVSPHLPRIAPVEQLLYLESLGFQTVRHKVSDVTELTLERLETFLGTFRYWHDFAIDGIVVQPTHAHPRNTSGNPPYAFAFKINPPCAIGEVTSVEWNETRRGLLKPKVLIKPIPLDGITISKLNGFNARFIEQNGIGPGALITVTRSGHVIPHIESIVRKGEATIPGDVDWDGADIRVRGTSGRETVQSVQHFFKGIGAKGFGPALVKRAFDAGHNTIQKIIDMKLEDFEYLTREGSDRARWAFKSKEDAVREASLPQILAFSGEFPGLGLKKVTDLLAKVPHLLTGEPTIEEIAAIRGFSRKSAEKVIERVPHARAWALPLFKLRGLGTNS